MKYDYEDGTTVETNFDDEGTRMVISPEAVAHVINVLTDLYSDPAEAAARETLTNAIDAQIANGVTGPIRVFLPTEFSSVFEVVDRGTGMTEHTLRHEFGQYGFSSKRDSNDFNGMLGLGCKAPLTYTPQFTVVSVKDGLRNTAAVVRGKDGVGRVKIPEPVRNVPTDEPDGTTVQIPVIDVDTFNAKVRNILRFWDPGTVLVNGESPEHIWEAEDVIALDEDVLLVPKSAVSHSDRVHVVMAGVTYPLDRQYSDKVTRALGYGTTVVARIPTGSVNIPATRDALTYTSKTEDLIATLADYVTEATERRFTEKITAATSAAEAMEVATEARKVLRNFDGSWQGHSIPTYMRASWYARGSSNVRADFGMKWSSNENLWNVTANSMKATSHNLPEDKKTLVVSGYDNTSVSAINKAKVQHWVKQQDAAEVGDIGLILFRSETSHRISIWLDDTDRTLYAPWEEVKDVDLPDEVRRAAGYTRPSSSGRTSTAAPSDDLTEVRKVKADGGYRIVERETVQSYERVVLLAPSDRTKSEREALLRRIDPLGFKIIVVNKSRHDEAHDLFDNLITEEEVEEEAARVLRQRHDALPILDAAYKHEFAWEEFYSSAKRDMESLIRAAGGSDFFADDHRIKSLKAIVDRLNTTDSAMHKVNEFIRAARTFYGYGNPLPIYIAALVKWSNDGPNRSRKPMDPLMRDKAERFNDAYPLFEHLRKNSEGLNEYARLLTEAA